MIIIIITIEPLLTSLASCLTLGYLDDLTMGDRQPAVAADVQRVTVNVNSSVIQTHPLPIYCCYLSRVARRSTFHRA